MHAYTIVDAINDENVLKLRVDYINTIKMKDGVKDKKVRAIDIEAAASSPERIKKVTDYIIEHFDQKTRRNDGYFFNRLTNVAEVVADKRKSKEGKVKEIKSKTRLKGFNSIFAVSSIDMARKYYHAFKSRDSGLKIATIFSFSANEEELESANGILPDEGFDTNQLDQSSRDFLESAITDYNAYFGTSYDTSADKFENYYKDLAQRMKNREVDLLIVVNMLLTGFDATTLNTLWVDKNLRYHGLLQAFSRTNRILNSIKTYGNIICFRDLEEDTNKAMSMFGNEQACGIVLLKPFNDYYYGWEKDGEPQTGYVDMIAELQDKFSLPIAFESEQAEKDFIKKWGAILRLRNILVSFDEFESKGLLSKRDIQNYESRYLDLRDKYRKHNNADKENINDDIVFEMELMKQVTVNIDYILQMVAQYYKSNMKDKEVLSSINSTISSSIDLRSKKELIENFINTLNTNSEIDKDWRQFTEKSKAQDLERIIEEEHLRPEKTKKFMNNAFRDGELKSSGTGLSDILPPVSMFDKNNSKAKKKTMVLEKLRAFFDKYLGI